MCSSPKRIPYFQCFNSGLIMPSKLLINQFLEYSSPVWSPWLLKVINCIVGVQHFFTQSLFRRIRCPITDYSDGLGSLQLDPWNI